MTGSVVKCSKRHERSGRCIETASVPEILYREGGLEGEGGHIRSDTWLADDGKCTQCAGRWLYGGNIYRKGEGSGERGRFERASRDSGGFPKVVLPLERQRDFPPQRGLLNSGFFKFPFSFLSSFPFSSAGLVCELVCDAFSRVFRNTIL